MFAAILLLAVPALARATPRGAKSPSKYPSCAKVLGARIGKGGAGNSYPIGRLCQPVSCMQSYGNSKVLTVIHGLSKPNACLYGQQTSRTSKMVCTLSQSELLGFYYYAISGSDFRKAQASPAHRAYVHAFMQAGATKSRCRQFPIFRSQVPIPLPKGGARATHASRG